MCPPPPRPPPSNQSPPGWQVLRLAGRQQEPPLLPPALPPRERQESWVPRQGNPSPGPGPRAPRPALPAAPSPRGATGAAGTGPRRPPPPPPPPWGRRSGLAGLAGEGVSSGWCGRGVMRCAVMCGVHPWVAGGAVESNPAPPPWLCFGQPKSQLRLKGARGLCGCYQTEICTSEFLYFCICILKFTTAQAYDSIPGCCCIGDTLC